ncbi:MAG: RdgB/HAM1 family non-canonical purine NTP pyrophosphatase [Lachnospiraceae bacterium]|nr:RdgB/HAM1 family non-canonical purine NTP pyrophosphatase [Lachnospiraceae bacterium]
MKIIFATGNKGKLAEIEKILDNNEFEIISMKEAGFNGEIVEDGTTYEENALIKVRAVREYLLNSDYPGRYIVMADDSGLEVDYLGGKPGIYSARYMGEDTPYSVKNQAIIDALEGVPDEQRGARFVCAIAMIFPDGTEKTTRAYYEGIVAREAKGSNGFGYDPMFFVPRFNATDAELPIEVKNNYSHRAQALRQAEKIIREYMI